MQLVLIRHGDKLYTPGHPEAEWPLDPSARAAVLELRTLLHRQGVAPQFYLTSRWQHARDTTRILAGDTDDHVVAVTGLTPHTDDRHFTWSAMLNEATAHEAGIAAAGTLALVGHHPRLSQLAEMLTGSETRELKRLEALILAADATVPFRLGAARVAMWCGGEKGTPGTPATPAGK